MKRTYTIPLRRECRETERYNKTKRAVSGIRKFLQKHMKTDDVKIGTTLNLQMWTRGGRNPPHKITVVTEKNDEGTVFVELDEAALPSEVAKAQAAEEQKESAKDKKKADVASAKESEEKSEESKAPAKKAAKTPSTSTSE